MAISLFFFHFEQTQKRYQSRAFFKYDRTNFIMKIFPPKIKYKISNFIENLSVAYYLTEFEKIQKKQLSWNWSAFLFGPIWLVYRKMFLQGLASSIIMSLIFCCFYIPLIMSTNCKDILTSSLFYITIFTFLFFMTLHGILGNRLYYQHIKKQKFLITKAYQPISPFIASICLTTLLRCINGPLWLRYYMMHNQYRYSPLTALNALFGDIFFLISIIISVIIIDTIYSLICKRIFVKKITTFNKANTISILTIKNSAFLWLYLFRYL